MSCEVELVAFISHIKRYLEKDLTAEVQMNISMVSMCYQFLPGNLSGIAHILENAHYYNEK